jgi:hypothetical protein
VEEQVLRLGDGGAVLLAYQERTQIFAVGVEKLDLLCTQASKADVNKTATTRKKIQIHSTISQDLGRRTRSLR